VTEILSRHRELADFLRTRRQRLTPESVGLPRTGRRRTPGLRREELATLAGVGVTWYTWLEQGRPINVSAQVLGAIASTLRLDASERDHLFTLAEVLDPEAPPTEPPLPAAVQRMLDALMPNPSYVLSEKWDLLAWNQGAVALMLDFGALPVADRNLSLLLFTRRELRARMLDWDRDARRHVAILRGAMAAHAGEPAFERLAARLRAESVEFREFWERHEVARPAVRLKRFRIPGIGILRLDALGLWLVDRPGARMVSYTPADEPAALGLRRLVPSAVPSTMDGLALSAPLGGG
jgi:transcriptional regulator with XRE-family HTH domain